MQPNSPNATSESTASRSFFEESAAHIDLSELTDLVVAEDVATHARRSESSTQAQKFILMANDKETEQALERLI
jgi:hypothetical protein